MLKLVIVVGTRPEIIRLAETIKCACKMFDVVLIHTGQNYDKTLKDVFMDELGLSENSDLEYKEIDCVGENLGHTVGNVIRNSYELFSEIKPDALLILGDTNSCLSAYSAKRLKIPIFHMEAGNRCFDPNVPEEVNRMMIDRLSDINICYTEHARRNLIAEGMKPAYTFVVGSPMPEVIDKMYEKIEASDVLERLSLERKKYILISSHREENVDNPIKFQALVDSITKIAETYNKPVIITTHPRLRKKIEENGIRFPDSVTLSDPFGFTDYCWLQMNSFFVASDSGTLTEESNYLNFPAVLIRDSTEHPEGIDAGTIVLGTVHWDSLQNSIETLLESKSNPDSIYPYAKVSEIVCKIISGYTPIVNKFLWMK